MRPTLTLIPQVLGRRQFSLSQRMRLQDNWDQEALPGANIPFSSKLNNIRFQKIVNYSLSF